MCTETLKSPIWIKWHAYNYDSCKLHPVRFISYGFEIMASLCFEGNVNIQTHTCCTPIPSLVIQVFYLGNTYEILKNIVTVICCGQNIIEKNFICLRIQSQDPHLLHIGNIVAKFAEPTPCSYRDMLDNILRHLQDWCTDRSWSNV